MLIDFHWRKVIEVQQPDGSWRVVWEQPNRTWEPPIGNYPGGRVRLVA